MIKTLFALLLMSSTYPSGESIIRDNIKIILFPYEYENSMRATAMPEIKAESELMKHPRRFEYLLINISEVHQIDKRDERNEIGKLYPDTNEIKRIYMDKYALDKKLTNYMEETYAAIKKTNKQKRTYSQNELFEVASKFFYCKEVAKDTTIQSYVCIGNNGVREIKSETDFTLLAAFCYEAIFNDFEADTSEIYETYSAQKQKACEDAKVNFSSFETYLEDVKQNLFLRMKNDAVLKKKLLLYYEANKTNLTFRIE